MSMPEPMPAVVAATIFGSQCSSLLSLSIQIPLVSLAGADEITALAALTRLTHLEVCGSLMLS